MSKPNAPVTHSRFSGRLCTIVIILGETCLVGAHTLRDLDQRCKVVDERRGTGKGPDCFELFKTVVENSHVG